MTDSRFEKLVNLYLDKEINPGELSDLKAEIAHNLVRRKTFERLCKVHSASRKALIGHSSSSGVSKFLKEELNTVERRKGGRTRVRRAGTADEVQKNARHLLVRGMLGFVCITIIAGLVTAYLIDNTVSNYHAQKNLEESERPDLDSASLKAQMSAAGQADSFIFTSMQDQASSTVSQIFVIRMAPPASHGLQGQTEGEFWTFFEMGPRLSPTEAHHLEKALKSCAGQLPGTTAPADIPPPRAPVLLTGGNEFPLGELQ